MSEQPHWNEPIAEGCYMIGRRNPDSILQCNTYLRSFERSGKSPIHWCIDPGSQLDFPQVRQHLLGHIGEFKALKLFSINHQDPDGERIPGPRRCHGHAAASAGRPRIT